MILSEKQKEWIRNSTHRLNFKIGARRCGKSYIDCLFTIPERLLAVKGKDGLNCIFGVSKGTIERNVLQPLREIYGVNNVSTINSNNIAILFGEEVYCLGCEKKSQVAKIQGSSIKYAYGDEIAKWEREVFYMILASLDKPYSKMDGALNPENQNHWFKVEILDKIVEKNLDIYVQYYTIYDNPFLSKEFIENLCKEYEGTVFFNRLILGQWCNAEGLIFLKIANNSSVFETDEIQNNSFISIGIDWGGNGSAHSITATKISLDYKNIEVLRSERLKAKGTDTIQLFRWIINFIIQIQDRYGSVSVIFCDSAEQVLINSLRSELQKNKIYIPIKNSIKIEIKNRIQLISRLLNLVKLKFIKNQCKELIIALQTALFDDKSKEDRWIDDGKTSDIDSLDSFWYSIEKWYDKISFMIGR